MYPISLQINEAANKFLDYGVIGAVVIVLFLIAYTFYRKIDENSKEWKDQAITMNDKYSELLLMQNNNHRELIEIRKKDVLQDEKYHETSLKELREMPERLIKELEFRELQKRKNINTTPLD